MGDVAPVRQNIPTAGSQFLSAVSENLMQSLAGTMNFINYFQHSEKQFFLNGPYSLVNTPQVGADGLVVFEFNAQIIDVWMFNLVAGTSGSTEIDVLLASSSGGSFASIFTTVPQINYAAGNNAWVGCPTPSLIGPNYSPPSYSAPANTTAPVLNTAITNVITAGSAMYCSLLAAQVGGQNCGVLIHYRPR